MGREQRHFGRLNAAKQQLPVKQQAFRTNENFRNFAPVAHELKIYLKFFRDSNSINIPPENVVIILQVENICQNLVQISQLNRTIVNDRCFELNTCSMASILELFLLDSRAHQTAHYLERIAASR